MRTIGLPASASRRSDTPAQAAVSPSIRRRAALGLPLLVGAGALRPCTARGAGPRKPARIGILAVAPEDFRFFGRHLKLAGLEEGRDVVLVHERAQLPEQLDDSARKLVAQKVDLIVAASTREVFAAQRATRTLPIVVAYGLAPVEFGFVASLARPGSNVTGTLAYPMELIEKSVEIFREFHPRLRKLALLLDPGPFAPLFQQAADGAALALGIATLGFTVHDDAALGVALDQAERFGANGLFVSHDLFGMYPSVAEQVAARRLPTLYPTIPIIREGGLIALAPNLPLVYQSTARIVARLLAGARPQTTPVEQPTRYVLALNLRTAKALALQVPKSVLLRADVVVD